MDYWLSRHIEIELEKAKSNLQKITDNGFVKIEKRHSCYDIYKKGEDRIFYDSKNDMVALRYNLKKLMEGTC